MFFREKITQITCVVSHISFTDIAMYKTIKMSPEIILLKRVLEFLETLGSSKPHTRNREWVSCS